MKICSDSNSQSPYIITGLLQHLPFLPKNTQNKHKTRVCRKVEVISANTILLDHPRNQLSEVRFVHGISKLCPQIAPNTRQPFPITA